MNIKKSLLLPVIAILSITQGCTSLISPTKKDIESSDKQASAYLDTMRNAPTESRKHVDHVNGIWMPVRKIDAANSSNASGKRRISINREFFSIRDVAERVTVLTGIPVSVAPDVFQSGGSSGGGAGMPVPLAGGAGNPSGIQVPAMPGVMSGSMNMPPLGEVSPASTQVMLSYDGTLAGFLDVVAARFGIAWEWSGNSSNASARFYRYTTKTLRLYALPGDMAMQSTISNQTGSSGGGSGGSSSGGNSSNASSGASSHQTGVSFSGLSVWTAIHDAIKNMLSAQGKVVVTAATGTVTVTDTPQIVAQVESFVNEQNASLGKQVVVNVRVLSVDLNDSDDYGINWDIIYNSMSGNVGWNWSNNFTTAPGSTDLALKILGTAGSVTNSNIKSWQGSQAVISALSKQGKVSQLTSASLTTLNNQPAPLQVGRQTSYLASSTTTVTQGAGSTTTLQPGSITTGFTMSLVPHLLDNGRLMLQYSIDISALLSLEKITSGDSSIQTPDVDTRNFMQRVMLNSGDTLVMSGFEQSTQRADSQGVGSAQNTWFGGGITGAKTRTILVILIQPVVAEM